MGAPAILDIYAQQTLELLNDLAAWHYNRIAGCVVADNSSTQATGTNGVLTLHLNTTQIVDAVVQGNPTELAAQTSATAVATAAAAILWGATSGKACVFAVLLSTGSADDTPAIACVAGTVAATASAVAPTDAAITTALGHSNWVRAADVTVVRTADTTVTVAVDHTVRPSVTAWPGDFAETEADLRA